jgi:hypothetical protein
LTPEQLAEALGSAVRMNGFWRALCPSHEDSHPSLDISAGNQQPIIFKCRAGCTNSEIIDGLKSRGLWPLKDATPSTSYEGRHLTLVKKDEKKEDDEWDLISPVTDDAPPPPIFPKYTFRWGYRSAEKRLLAYIDRIDGADGKQIIPLTLWRSKKTGALRWQRKGIRAPKPLYGLDLLAESPELPVVIVEGEKCADAARRLVRTHVIVS